MSKLNYSDREVRERQNGQPVNDCSHSSHCLLELQVNLQVISTRPHLTPGASACLRVRALSRLLPTANPQEGTFLYVGPASPFPHLCLQLMKILPHHLSSAFPLLHVQECLQNSGTMGTLSVLLSHVPGDFYQILCFWLAFWTNNPYLKIQLSWKLILFV